MQKPYEEICLLSCRHANGKTVSRKGRSWRWPRQTDFPGARARATSESSNILYCYLVVTIWGSDNLKNRKIYLKLFRLETVPFRPGAAPVRRPRPFCGENPGSRLVWRLCTCGATGDRTLFGRNETDWKSISGERSRATARPLIDFAIPRNNGICVGLLYARRVTDLADSVYKCLDVPRNAIDPLTVAFGCRAGLEWPAIDIFRTAGALMLSDET